MKFPDWAPKSLIDEYYRLKSRNGLCDDQGYNQERIEILIRLTNATEMKGAWKRLYKQRQSIHPQAWNGLEPNIDDCDRMALRLYFAILEAMHYTRRKYSTRSEDAEKYQTIANLARRFAREVQGSKLDRTPYRWYPIEALNTIIEKDIKPEKLAGQYCRIKDRNILEPFKISGEDGTEREEYINIADDTRQLFIDHLITPKYPVMSIILKALADDADKLVCEVRTEPRLADKSSASESTIFIRALSKFWLDEFESPLYGTFAAICQAALDEPGISDETVKDALNKKRGG